MLCNRSNNIEINDLNKKYIRLLYRDKQSSYEHFLEKRVAQPSLYVIRT